VTLAWAEAAARSFEPPATQWATPGALAQHLDPRTVQTPALDLIDAALVQAFRTPDARLIISMPPQEGKSTRATRNFPLWVLTQAPDTRVVAASYGQGLANGNGRAIRNTILANPEATGLRIAPDNGAAHEWQIAGHDGGVLSVGVGAGLTGRPADLLIIDDPIKDRKEADSETFRNNVWEWWTDVASTRLAPGASVVLILTRWHEDDIAGRLKAAEDGHLWRVINIPAQADHKPEKGQVDPLGREPGEFMASARRDKQGLPRTTAQWEAIKVRVGSRTWNALYQGRPSPAEGGIVKRDWWRYYQTPLWIDLPDGTCRVTGFDEVMQSWDMTFKDTDSSDYVVGQVWGRIGATIYLLDQVRGRWDFPETLRRVKALTAKWPDAVLKLVEDKANGTAVIASLTQSIGGMVPEVPTESKTARVNAVAPLVEARNVHLPDPELAPWVDAFVEEWASFPNATHDDQVDAGSQAIKRLGIMPLLAGTVFGDTTDDYDYDDWSISPY
jgi:predicted phage terminase large subunit-like protein